MEQKYCEKRSFQFCFKGWKSWALPDGWCLVGVNSKHRVQSKWKCETADPFATKLSLMVHHHKPGCLVIKVDCCVQGQGPNKGSKCLWMFVWISFEPLHIWLWNLLCWGIIMWKKLVCCLQGQGHIEGSYNQNMFFYYSVLATDFLHIAATLSLMIYYHKLKCCKKIWLLCSRSRSQERLKVSVFILMMSSDLLNLL